MKWDLGKCFGRFFSWGEESSSPSSGSSKISSSPEPSEPSEMPEESETRRPTPMKLSEHFALWEFTTSQEATRRGIDNSIPIDLVPKLRDLCDHVLEPVRAEFGAVRISSGWRSEALNKAINGSKNSQHSKAEAADFECYADVSNLLVAQWIQRNCEFDQLILEYHDHLGDPKSGWVHCSYRAGNNRKEVLRINKGTGYRKGLPV